MDMFHMLYLFYLGAAFIKCNPIEKRTLYEAVAEKCPAKTASHFNEHIFHLCNNDWEKISNTFNLTENTKNDVLCLLYFDSFVLYCNQTQQVNTNLTNLNINLNVDTICDNLNIILKQIDVDGVLRKILATKEDCKRLCSDGFGLTVPVCHLSYYYYQQAMKSAVTKDHFIPVPKDDINVQQTPPEHKEQNPPTSENSVNVHSKESVINHANVQQNPVDTENNHPQPGNNEPEDNTVETGKKPNTDNTINESENVHGTEQKKDPSESKPVEESKPKILPTKTEPVLTSKENQDNQIQKNAVQDKNLENDVDDVGNDELIQPNNEPKESEENVEEQSNPVIQKSSKPMQLDDTEAVNFTTDMEGDSYFFTYFMLLCVIFILGYVCYHNKQKILALILEGRRGKRQYRGRRPNSANYHKLDSNLEEAITSSCNKNTSNVIY